MLLKRLTGSPPLCLRAGAGGVSRSGRIGRLQPLLRVFLLTAGLLAASVPLLSTAAARAQTAGPGAPVQARETARPATVVDLQPYRRVDSVNIVRPDGQTAGLTLINLNPNVNRWYILQINRNSKSGLEEYHLENPYPNGQRLALDHSSPDNLLVSLAGEAYPCKPWSFSGDGELEAARESGQAFAPLCGGKIYLRNPTRGHRTAIETVTDFLRDKLPGGESVVGFVKDTFFQDAYLENARIAEASAERPALSTPDVPAPAAIDPLYATKLLGAPELGIEVEKSTAGMLTGRWYGVKDSPGIFVSLIQPGAVAPEILKSHANLVSRLDSVEAGALAYLVAYDLDRFDLGFAVGTEHPRVGWSERTLEQMRVPGLPGPDGIGTISPLVATGIVNPAEAARAVSTFTGGFKRSHGAFKYGDFAYRNRGSHYGFIENGVVLSRLQPGLATVVVRAGGTVEMKSWSEADNQYLGDISQARQNGVPLIEWDAAAQKPVPGGLVARWGAGNWSGSADTKLRTLRAGAAVQQTGSKRFLVYGYFSTATPSAMARVFQAYNCRYAMHLDMNALEHTYLALYHREGSHLLVQHLIRGMDVLDKADKGVYIPRFLGYSDNRDFFYVMKRE